MKRLVMGNRRCRAVLGLALLVASVGPPAVAQLFEVTHRSAETLYVGAGSVAGLAVGSRLEVVRGADVIAELEVLYAAERSASCRLLVERESVVVGDLVRGIPAPRAGRESAAEVELAERPASAASDPPDGAVERSTAPATLEPAPAAEARTSRPVELALDEQPVVPIRWQPKRRGGGVTGTRFSGTVGVDWESSQEGLGAETIEYGRLHGRLDLRLRDIGGLPYELRARLRTQQNRRGSGEDLEIESRDRFYEFSLTFDPPQGRYAYRVGRMSASPFVGIGYFDGALGQFALSSIFEIGAFAGSSAEVDRAGFTTERQKYGVFGRFTASTTDSGFPWEVVVAGIREHGLEDISREYVSLQSRYSAGSRWSFFQRAEIDLNRGWRAELSGSSSQLSNFSLSATARLSRYGRLSLAYDRFEQYRTEETRELPEDLFRDLQRQGVRANLQIGNPRRLNFALTASLRDQAGEEAATFSYGFWVRHGRMTPLRLSLAFNYLAFSNQFTTGYLSTLRTSKHLKAGHQLDLTVGTRLSASELFAEDEDERTNWVRCRVWVELPKSLYSTSELELTEGALEGRRLSVGLGYRF